MVADDGLIAFQAGASYPLDDYIEQAVTSRIPGRFVSYASILSTYQDNRHIDDIDTRIGTLRRLLEDRIDTSFVLMGRSSGARAITRLAAAPPPNLRGVVCLGYPFRNPTRPPEPERTAHLTAVAVPTLIVQGASDVYGGAAEIGLYPLSPHIVVAFVEASHEFNLSPEAWEAVATRIRRFIDGLPSSVGPKGGNRLSEKSRCGTIT